MVLVNYIGVLSLWVPEMIFFCIFLKTPIKLVKLNFLYNFLIWMIANIYLLLSYFLKGFTSVCLRISTRYKAIFINTYFDSNS